MNKINVAIITALLMLGLFVGLTSGMYYSTDGLFRSPDGNMIEFNETGGATPNKYLILGNNSYNRQVLLLEVNGYSSFKNDVLIAKFMNLTFWRNCFIKHTGLELQIQANAKINITSLDTVEIHKNLTVEDTITAQEFIGAGITPIGGIIIWYGNLTTFETIRNSDYGIWAICNGTIQNGMYTPDLRDRFVLGGGGNATLNSTDGKRNVTLTIPNLPSHYHNLPMPIVTAVTATSISCVTGPNACVGRITVTTNSNTRNEGSGTSFSVMNPYRCLYYIMRVG